MTESKHTFSHDYLNISTDYELLWSLIQSGKRVPAWLVYCVTSDGDPIWDIVEVKKRALAYDGYIIGTRGIGYEGLKDSFDDFKRICEKWSLHFAC